ncbi:MAG: beta-ribofuranosylaminobenzene 5'-phosphate synthase [Methanoregula sp.]|uniref:beta-ribofuranosylaminobenzene 5'-phosphate synthase n=1 Tax=Methanoregula sp. TaxID=2052170 RepID=UPI003BAFB42B
MEVLWMDIAHRLKEIEEHVGRLSPVQKILLGTDGSVTQLLESVTGHPVSVRTREQEIVKADTLAAERLNIARGDAVNHRIVELMDATSGEVLVYATSQTPVARLAPEFRDDLMKADIPIGKIIGRHHIEARREILTAQVTSAGDDVSGIFSICKNEPLLMRQYQIIHGGEPLIFIEEQFPYNKFLDEHRVIVRTPSRIHITLLDMNGGLGRVDGGIGIALDAPSILLEAQASPSLEVHGCDRRTEALVRDSAESVLARIHAGGSVSLTVREHFPTHIGLGGGSQIAIATARACMELYGKTLPTAELARIVGRGGTSGIGTAAFDHGGFIIDGGHRFGPGCEKTGFAPSSASKGVQPPPVLVRHEFPGDWRILLAIPALLEGASGTREQEIFRTCCPVPVDEVRMLCHEVLMRMLPGLAERDLDLFGTSVNAIQELGFKKVELAIQPREVTGLLDTMRAAGAAGAGMSSFGPTMYAITDTGMQEIERAAKAFMQEIGGGTTIITSARNSGAAVRIA